jgi:CBS domain-containing protein
MTREPVVIAPATTIRELARLLEENEISGMPVVDEEGRLVGVVSKTDLMRRCLDEPDDRTAAYLVEFAGAEPEDGAPLGPEELIVVEDFMTSDPVTARPDEPVVAIARRMVDARVHRVVVVDPDRVPIGIVTSLDLLRAWAG